MIHSAKVLTFYFLQNISKSEKENVTGNPHCNWTLHVDGGDFLIPLKQYFWSFSFSRGATKSTVKHSFDAEMAYYKNYKNAV